MSGIDPRHVSHAAPKPVATAPHTQQPRPVAPAPAAPPATIDPEHPGANIADEATRLAIASIFSKLAQIRRDVMQMIASPSYQQQLTEHLLKSGAFNELINASQETVLARLNVIEGLLRGQPIEAYDPAAKITGFMAQIHNEQSDVTAFQAMIHPDNHPVSPGELELYRDEDGTGHWHQCQYSPLVEEAVRKAFKKAGDPRGARYWLELIQITDRPIGPHSVRMPHG